MSFVSRYCSTFIFDFSNAFVFRNAILTCEVVTICAFTALAQDMHSLCAVVILGNMIFFFFLESECYIFVTSAHTLLSNNKEFISDNIQYIAKPYSGVASVQVWVITANGASRKYWIKGINTYVNVGFQFKFLII